MKKVKLKVQDYEDVEKMVFILAKNGYKTWFEENIKNYEVYPRTVDFSIYFEIEDSE